MRLLLFAAPAVFVLAACATNPATGHRQLMLMSEAQEIQMGRDSDAQVRKEMGVYNDAELQRYINDVGQRLARASHRPSLPWTFAVVDSSAVNAFALPGGYIYVTRGILPFLHDEAELAAVMGHEVGHVDARHSANAYSKQLALGGTLAAASVLVPSTQPLQGLASTGLEVLLLKYSRENELESDRLGTGYASAAGWDPGAMPDLLTTLGRLDAASGTSRGVPNWALTHPQAADRVTLVQTAVAAARAAGGHATNQDTFERRLNHVVYGDSREQGIVRGAEFFHPDLRFAIRFPAGWEVANGADQVTARPAGDSHLAMVLEVAKVTGALPQAARTQMTTAGFRQIDGASTDLNGLSAYVGVYESGTGTSIIRVRAAHIRVGNQTYLLAGVATQTAFAHADATFSNAIRSFRPLSAAEAERIQPSRVEFRTVRGGDTWETLARSGGDPNVKAATLAIMNGTTLDTAPRPGDRVRVVVGG